MKKLDGHLWNIIPKYAVLPLICSFTFNSLIYTGTQILCRDFKHYDFTNKNHVIIHDMILVLL